MFLGLFNRNSSIRSGGIFLIICRNGGFVSNECLGCSVVEREPLAGLYIAHGVGNIRRRTLAGLEGRLGGFDHDDLFPHASGGIADGGVTHSSGFVTARRFVRWLHRANHLPLLGRVVAHGKANLSWLVATDIEVGRLKCIEFNPLLESVVAHDEIIGDGDLTADGTILKFSVMRWLPPAGLHVANR